VSGEAISALQVDQGRRVTRAPHGVPVQTLADPVHLANPHVARLPRTFVYCSNATSADDWTFGRTGAYGAGWIFHALRCGHLGQATTKAGA
jgi:hypothetical protein